MKKSEDRIRTKGDGIRIVERGDASDRRALPLVAAAVVMVLAALGWWSPGSSPIGSASDEVASRSGQSVDQAAPRSERPHVSVRPARTVAASAPAADAAPLLDARTMEQLVNGTPETAPERPEEENRQMEKTARELLQAAVNAGETRGIAAFPPPGTDPIKVGLVVPPSYALPEGFIRHHQITDDGRRLEAILMFSPDYQFVDASGNPVTVPEDGVVPTEMAPAGLPLRVLSMPKNPYGPMPGSR